MKLINIKGVIVDNQDKEVYEWYGYEATSPNDIINNLSPNEDVEITVDSIGGSVSAGSEIYTALKQHNGKVIIKITARAYSIASIIAMAGDEIHISPSALFMIHNVSVGSGGGDYREFERTASKLKSATEGLAKIYVDRTGKSMDEILDLMNKETFLNAQQSVDNGFADYILFDSTESLTQQYKFSATGGTLLSPEQFEKFKNRDKNESMKMQLDLLKLKQKQQ